MCGISRLFVLVPVCVTYISTSCTSLVCLSVWMDVTRYWYRTVAKCGVVVFYLPVSAT